MERNDTKDNRVHDVQWVVDSNVIKLSEIARAIAEQVHELGNSGRISIDQLASIIDRVIPQGYGGVNCYPSNAKNQCCELAIFISLTSPAYVSSRAGHMNFGQLLEKFVQHMQGNCSEITRSALIITDNWDPSPFCLWQANINKIIKLSDRVEAYLMVNGTITNVPLVY